MCMKACIMHVNLLCMFIICDSLIVLWVDMVPDEPELWKVWPLYMRYEFLTNVYRLKYIL